MMIRFSFFAFLIFLLTSHAFAKVKDPLEKVSVEYRDHRYYVDYTVGVNVLPESIFLALTNYDNLDKFIPSMTRSLLIEQRDDYDLVETHFSNCLFLFCKKAVNTQKITHDGKHIRAETLVEQSDFKFGLMTWDIQNIEGATYLKYHAELEPKFWVPDLIGPAILKQKFKREAQKASNLMANF